MKQFFFILGLLYINLSIFAQPKVGDTIPNIILPTVKSDTFNFYESAKAKYYIIDFWASWCGPCLREMPKLKKYYLANKKNNVELISISLDEEKTDWLNMLKKIKTNWINLHSPGDWYSPMAIAWEIEQLPTMYLVNSKGVILAKGINLESLKKKIKF